jgi:prepilin-type processing-associated H-X9-DG protein
LNRWAHKGIKPPGPAGVLRPNYAGIAGAIDHPSTEDADDNAHPHNSTGKRSHGGVLVLRRHVYGSQIRDGLSNTMVVAEQSDWCRSMDGRALDCRSDEGHGFQMGPQPDIPDDQRAWNLTSVRYPVNSRAWEQKGVGETYYGVNHPILSAHVRTANVLLADGSVQRLSEATELQVLYNLSNRDDGNALGAVF